MELARRASRAPSIFTSSGPSGARGAEPVRRTALPVPALIVTSSDVRPPASRPEPATSSAGNPALRICGTITRCRRTRHSPVGAFGVPPIVGFAVGDAGQAEAGREQIERRQRHARRIRLEGQGRSSMAGERQAAGVDKKRQVLDVETVASVGQGRGRREREPTAAALRGKAGKLKARRRPAEEPPARRQREAARGPAEVEIAGRGAACRRQLDAGDRLPGDFGSGELREPGDDLRAPEVSDLEVDFEALEAIGVRSSSGRCSQRPRAIASRQRRKRSLSPRGRRSTS